MRNNDDDGDNNNGVCVMCGTSNKREEKQTNCTIIPFSPSLDKYNLLTNNSRKQVEEKSTQKKKHKKTYMSGKASDEEKAAPAYQTLVHFFIFTQQHSTVRITYALLYLPLSSAPSSQCSEYFEEKSEKTNNFLCGYYTYNDIRTYFFLSGGWMLEQPFFI